MDCNVSELVKQGHEQAADLKASCGAVDVRGVAKLISELATQLDVQLARSNALAAENAGLKSAAKETLAHWAAAEPGEMEKMMDKCMPALRVAYCETTSTDAILAEMRAQGVDALVERRLTAARLAKEAGHEITARDLEGEAIRARFFAMEIRKGVQS